MNNITIELCAEDRVRIDRLTDAVLALLKQNELPTVHMDLPVPLKPKAEEKPEKTATEPSKPSTLADTLPTDETASPASPAEPDEVETAEHVAEETEPERVITLTDVNALAMELIADGKTAAARAIVNEYAPLISKIDPAKYAEVFARLTALKEG